MRRFLAVVASRPTASDFDPVDEPRTRRSWARSSGAFAAVTAVATAPVPLVGLAGQPARPLAWPALVILVGLSVLLTWRSSRLGERALVAAQLAGLVAAAGMVLAAVPSGSALSAELVLVVPVVLGAVFARTSGQAWITALVGVVAAGSLSVHRLAEPADAFSQVAGQTVGVILLVVALRAVRDAAHRTSSALRRSEVTDQLTGVLNRVGFERLGGAAWGQAAGAGRQVAVLVLALDHFKTVNDLWGHGGGDDMLARLGAVLRECTRDGDLTVRLGGAEFAVLCPVEPGDGARVADRVRLDLAGRIAPGTVSIAVVEVAPSTDDRAVDELWRNVLVASSCLDRAKRTGRNRVVVQEV